MESVECVINFGNTICHLSNILCDVHGTSRVQEVEDYLKQDVDFSKGLVFS